jgi:3-deoxy-D-manno-octulosonic-acid transferase
LGRLYHLATLVFVGGSFVPRGGQNILEPAAAGRPVLFGPHMQNFRDSVKMLVGRGGIQVPDGPRLQQTMEALLAAPDEMAKLGRLAREVVDGVQGASRANAEAIAGLLAQGRREARS